SEDGDMARRSYGTGALYVRRDARGRATWYAKWRVGGRQVKRRIGAVRQTGTREGLTRAQAERELRRKIESTVPTISAGERRTVEEAGEQLVAHLSTLGRKPSTLNTYRSLLRAHLSPGLGELTLGRVEPVHVERLVASMRHGGAGAKLTSNALTLLFQVFEFGRRKGWCERNPVKQVDRPEVEQHQDIRFLTIEEVEALLGAVSDEEVLGPTDRALYMTAAMTGLRQGELLALRWRDVDWPAARLRVRQNYVRGHWGTPKSRRGSRSVPMVDRVAGELERHFQRSAFQADDELVFPHPHTGEVLDHSALVRRYKKALSAAGVREVRFNDLRHTFGTQMAAAGVPLRTLQEWMGHRDFKTTLIYADYAPAAHETEMAERAFARGTNRGTNLSESAGNSETQTPRKEAQKQLG
ncbi:MAG: tyrosine-type recombinase/integrase, partial [Solirubrobacterales bacterium]